ncbi:hypothetical protein AWZ03_012264 [Drosophila navojoa]|uniref:Uncharacterized protein n=1 Tax=Drosophila navojoa TaxID=7232 RepID=A0A484AY09_DRONA|nr:hypothetical protein AWZ03_012264 [Drosophila navojoa]
MQFEVRGRATATTTMRQLKQGAQRFRPERISSYSGEHIRESKESKLDEMGRNSKARSRENISRQKHSQTSLQILDDVSNRYYREAVPMSTQSSKADFKEKEHSILRRNPDMTQTSLCGGIDGDDGESSSTTTATHEMMTKAAIATAPVNACDMGCQTR